MSSNSQPTEINRKRIDRLFLSFSAFYGQLWRSQFKNEDFLEFMKNEWFVALQHVEDRNIAESVNYCRDNKEYPPTLPQFIDLCKAAKRRNLFKIKQKVESKKSTSEVALNHLAQIKKHLQMN